MIKVSIHYRHRGGVRFGARRAPFTEPTEFPGASLVSLRAARREDALAARAADGGSAPLARSARSGAEAPHAARYPLARERSGGRTPPLCAAV
ncbi:hypothetical protein BGLT_00177 [Caballeronia glathei]|jgi:hypothetical protein|uniref:Uncharacterized protein n=1 Tax=Caballeronia glathei TaxID=60547 RepID=A0A069PUY6_9BURK|nr:MULTISPECIES: hypothetical protein [Burkholderiaceae]KDR44593.1 hypothetical protein BG61_12530 [Caballeronia glathei]TCK44370.1 hypothetical protein B0G84_2734 [Paraburkholderia sp. BL8N3]CDY74001.1 hypothetical protein BGLT_00177 [Caballeronia glathei]